MRWDRNQFTEYLEKPIAYKSFSRILWSIVWKTFTNQSESCQLSNFVENPLEFCHLKKK